MASGAEARLQAKVNLFMEDFILPKFDPTRILWVFSLSGGVDSWVTREAIRAWYQEKSLEILEETLHVDQWDAPIADLLRKGHWGVSFVADKRATSRNLGFNSDTQAQCGPCSIIRRDATDNFTYGLLQAYPGTDVIVARGHHLTDLAVSILWRLLAGRSPVSDLVSSGKGHPLSELENRSYLAKPLIYATKSEIETVAKSRNLVGACACLSCPAHGIPSRRDIMNITAVPALAMSLRGWELQLPGVRDIIQTWTNDARKWHLVKELSDPDTSVLCSESVPQIPLSSAKSFYDNALCESALEALSQEFDFSSTLDAEAFSFLAGKPPLGFTRVPVPAYLLRHLRLPEENYSIRERLMMLCYGPFWGLFALPHELRHRAIEIRATLFPGITFDDTWGQSAEFFKSHDKLYMPGSK